MLFIRQLFLWKNLIVKIWLGSKYVSYTICQYFIWHPDRSIAETKIFRLGVCLMCLLYVKKEERIGKELYYRKIK